MMRYLQPNLWSVHKPLSRTKSSAHSCMDFRCALSLNAVWQPRNDYYESSREACSLSPHHYSSSMHKLSQQCQQCSKPSKKGHRELTSRWNESWVRITNLSLLMLRLEEQRKLSSELKNPTWHSVSLRSPWWCCCSVLTETWGNGTARSGLGPLVALVNRYVVFFLRPVAVSRTFSVAWCLWKKTPEWLPKCMNITDQNGITWKSRLILWDTKLSRCFKICIYGHAEVMKIIRHVTNSNISYKEI